MNQFSWQRFRKAIRETRFHGFTFLLIPHRVAGRRPFQIHLPGWVVYGVVGVGLTSLLFLTGSFFYSVRVAGKLEHYQQLKTETTLQKSKLGTLVKETKALKQSVQKLTERDKKLRRLLGLPTNVSQGELKPRTQLAAVGAVPTVTQLAKGLAELSAQIEKREHSYARLLERVLILKEQFASLPSAWPVRGELSSPFGYRSRPWVGFHSGLDISVAYGTPVRATADGEVIWAGWQSGYGYTIILKHGFGFTTRYGHNSRLAVRSGQKIRKGQIIAFVGSTGYSTGSHVHYEVMRYGAFLNPRDFLDLDLLTASRLLETGESSL